jgi:hypothetical protein
MYYEEKSLDNLHFELVLNGGLLTWSEKSLEYIDEGIKEKFKIEFAVPYFSHRLGHEDGMIDKQLYFQKWATRSIPFWKDDHENLILVQQANDDEQCVSNFHHFMNMYEWEGFFPKNFLSYTTKNVVYVLERENGFTFCKEIFFFDCEVKVKYVEDTLYIGTPTENYEFKIPMTADPQAFLLGTRQINNDYSYINLIF